MGVALHDERNLLIGWKGSQFFINELRSGVFIQKVYEIRTYFTVFSINHPVTVWSVLIELNLLKNVCNVKTTWWTVFSDCFFLVWKYFIVHLDDQKRFLNGHVSELDWFFVQLERCLMVVKGKILLEIVHHYCQKVRTSEKLTLLVLNIEMQENCIVGLSRWNVWFLWSLQYC